MINEIKPENGNPEHPVLDFTKSFWTIFIAIFVIQIIQVVTWIILADESFEVSQSYNLLSELLGMLWTLIMLLVVIVQIKQANILPASLFNFDFNILRQWLPKIFKYFLLCGAIVGIFAFIIPHSELGLEKRTTFSLLVSFSMVVIFAPLVEEMIFRGYLYTAMRTKFKRKKERLVVNAMFFAGAHVFILTFFLGVGVPYYIFFLGYFLAKLYDESNSVLPGIMLHSLNNLLVFIIEIVQVTSPEIIYT